MRFVFSIIFVALLIVYSANSAPSETENESSGSRTYTSLKNFFSPVVSWFRNDLPEKTPKDLATDIKNTAIDAKEWVEDNAFVRAAKKVISPVHTWVKSTVNSLKDKKLRDLYDDTKDYAGQVDKRVGEWIDSKVSPDVPEFK